MKLGGGGVDLYSLLVRWFDLSPAMTSSVVLGAQGVMITSYGWNGRYKACVFQGDLLLDIVGVPNGV